MLDMLSTPPTSTTSLAPVCTIIEPVTNACSPLPHRRSVWNPGTEIGRPACSAAQRPMQGVSEFAYDCANATSSIRSGSIPRPLHHRGDHRPRQILHRHRPQGAPRRHPRAYGRDSRSRLGA